MNKNDNKYKDYKFVGNTETNGDLSELKNIKYIVGELAYDIHGQELDRSYMRPLFIANESYEEYDRIMMKQLRAIRGC